MIYKPIDVWLKLFFLDFIIVAFVMFMIKQINRTKEKEEAAAEAPNGLSQ